MRKYYRKNLRQLCVNFVSCALIFEDLRVKIYKKTIVKKLPKIYVNEI